MPRSSALHFAFVISSSSHARLASLDPPPSLCYQNELLRAWPFGYFRLLRGNVLVVLIQKIDCCIPSWLHRSLHLRF